MATTKALELAQLADSVSVNANGEITNIGTLSSLDISGDTSTQTLTVNNSATITGTYPTLSFVDTDNNPDFTVVGGSGQLGIYDDTNNAYVAQFRQNGLTLTGDLTLNNANNSSQASLRAGEHHLRGTGPGNYEFIMNVSQNNGVILGSNPGSAINYNSGAYLTLGSVDFNGNDDLIRYEGDLLIIKNQNEAVGITNSLYIEDIKSNYARGSSVKISSTSNTATNYEQKGIELSISNDTGDATGIEVSSISNSGNTALAINATAGDVQIADNLVVGGDLLVSGNTTYINTNNLAIEDLNITLASGSANSAVADGAGITIDGANATFTYESATDVFAFNKHFKDGTLVDRTLNIVDQDYYTGNYPWRLQDRGGSFQIYYYNEPNMFTIKDNGNVGIGTDDPSYLLHIDNVGGGSGIALQDSNDAGSTALHFLNNTGTIVAEIEGLSDNTGMAFNTNGEEAMRIDSSGKVGIGTPTPNTFLEVAGPATTNTTGVEQVLRLSRAQTDAQSFYQFADFKLGRHTDSGGAYEAFTRLDIDLRDDSTDNSAFNKVMTLTNHGRVGVGTSNPRTTLHLASVNNTRITLNNTTNSGKAGVFTLDENDVTQTEFYYEYGSNKQFLAVNGNGFSIYSKQVDTPIMEIASSSGAGDYYNVAIPNNNSSFGIGTNDPNAKLHSVVADVGDASLRLSRTNSSAFEFQHGIPGVTGDALLIKDISLSYDYLTLRSSNVGIGTDNPHERLHVQGKALIRDGGYPFLEMGISDSNYFRMVHDNPNDSVVFQRAGTDGNIMTLHGGTGQGVTIGTESHNKNLTVHGEITADQYNNNEVRHNILPSLNLDFAKSKTLDSRFTFHRNSVATYIDSKGLVRYATHNEPRFDHDFYTRESKGLLIEEERTNYFRYTGGHEGYKGYWSGYGLGTAEGRLPVVESNYAMSPDGRMNATRLYLYKGSGSGGGDRMFWRKCNPEAPNDTQTLSVWAKSNTGSDQYCSWHVNGGCVGFFTVTNEWQRFEHTNSMTGTACFGLEISGSVGSAQECDILIWGLQMERGNFATSFIPSEDHFISRTSEATYYDRNGHLTVVPENVPRYGYAYNGKEWVETGLILEYASTNLFKNSEFARGDYSHWQFGSWNNSIYTYGVEQLELPTGVYGYALAITRNGGESSADFHQGNTPQWVEGTHYTLSAWVKGSGAFKVFTQSGYTLISETASFTLTNEWQRISVTYRKNDSSGTGNSYPYFKASSIVNGTTMYIWGAQAEVGTSATSYIPTYDSTATRNSDIASSTQYTRMIDRCFTEDLNWYNEEESTIYAEASSLQTINSGIYSIHNEYGDNFISSLFWPENDMTVQYYKDSVLVVNRNLGPAPDINTTAKIANSHDSDSVFMGCNGTDTSDSTVEVPYGLTRLTLGDYGSSPGSTFAMNGHIKKLSVYSEKMSREELKALTEND